MKKKIAILLILVLVGSSVLWAKDRTPSIILDITMIGVGGFIAAGPLVFGPGDYDIVYYSVGGLLGGIGLIALIADAITHDPSTAQIVDDNKILKHVSFDIAPDNSVFLGAKFNLDTAPSAPRNAVKPFSGARGTAIVWDTVPYK